MVKRVPKRKNAKDTLRSKELLLFQTPAGDAAAQVPGGVLRDAGTPEVEVSKVQELKNDLEDVLWENEALAS